ncbi:hypothetical protein M2118_000455 [Aurantimicrobium minutum]|uniref:hypothetical protein n=1 Tax=Aurantimicrobium minutum TaxID=708131 RepID=UPI002476D492|nr:hypothetical protein [Aurantimicrobium minutum]MDH6277504.1 hypothetical protein [Aurantimicrobium minutum]
MKTALEQLREVIDELTTITSVDIRQESEHEIVITKVAVQPLIGQLRTAIASSVAGGGQGSNLASERNVLNAEALDLYDRIEEGAVKLLTIYSPGAVPYLLPEQNIRQASVGIYKQLLDGTLDEARIPGIIRSVEGWSRAINRILNPPVTLELMGSCPECGETHAKVNESESGRALIIEWHNPDHGFSNALQNCLARCRSCRNVWLGDLQLRELAYVLEAKEPV